MRIIFMNADTGGVMEWTFEQKEMAHLFVPAIFKTFGEIPEHEYSDNGEILIIRVSIEQINRVREKLKPFVGQNPGVEKFYNDMTFLLTCSGFEIVK